MILIPVHHLSRHDMQLIGNNVLPAVQADRTGRSRSADRGSTIAWKPRVGIATQGSSSSIAAPTPRPAA